MKSLLLAAAAVIAVPVIAQTVPPPGAGLAGDRFQARAEVVQRIERMFAMLDTNRDGVLDRTELAAASEGGWGRRAASGDPGSAPRAPLDKNAVFDLIDTNHDGSVSRDEFARAHSPAMHHGMAQSGPGEGAREGHGHGAGMARLFAMADSNGDGKVTLKEATDTALRRFDLADANHDGQLTPEEREAARGAMRGR